MTLHRFFVNKISGATAVIDGSDYNHAVNVLRLAPGSHLIVFNYEHGEWEARVDTLDRAGATLTVVLLKQLRARAANGARITAVCSLIKKDNWELLLEKLTETGVDTIIPLITKRTVVEVKDTQKKRERWEKIIHSAVKQCGRLTSPSLLDPVKGVEKLQPQGNAANFFVYEKAEGVYLLDEAYALVGGPRDACFMTGPEGGFTDEEADIITGKNFRAVSLGDNILRAETAAIASATVLSQALRRSVWKS